MRETNPSENRERRTRSAAAEKQLRRHRLLVAGAWTAGLCVISIAAVAWLGVKATTIKSELEAASQLIPVLKQKIADNNPQEAGAAVDKLRSHAAAAREAAGDPLWTLASAIPGLGANFSAAAEVARSADDVAALGVALSWQSLIPSIGTASSQAAATRTSDHFNRQLQVFRRQPMPSEHRPRDCQALIPTACCRRLPNRWPELVSSSKQ